AAGCGAFMKGYGRLFMDDPGMSARAGEFSAKVADVSEFLEGCGAGAGEGGIPECVTYHEPCHLVHAQGISRQPRSLIASIPGVRFVELRDASRCCGSAGIYNIVRPDDSDELLRRKVAAIVATGAHIVVTGNPGCHLQIEKGLREAGAAVEVLHPVTLLHRAAGGAAS
ncbi:MAG TPA: (Fe-S)-binding protein, partial [Bacteroidota bacterium]|nr:(Fe-S)-binding protein [Bacteroidota bacterium]